MENLNAENVKKALKCCVTDSCFSCPYDDVGVYSQCVPTLLENTLALITSQEQRIKELTEENEKLKLACAHYSKELCDEANRTAEYFDKLEADNERLRAEVNKLDALTDEMGVDIDVKLKAIFELEDKLNAEKADVMYFKDQIRADTVRKIQEIIVTKYAVSKVHYVENEEPTITYQLTNWDLRVIAKEILEGEKSQ